MNYVSFKIKNFKGVQNLNFRLDKFQSPILTLVGLNESGKTTILEALSTFWEQIQGDEESTEPLLHTTAIDDVHSLVPKGKKANFNDVISLSARVHLDAEDKQGLERFLASRDWIATSIADHFSFTKEFSFQNSTYQRSRNLYALTIEGHKKGRRKAKTLYEDDQETWSAAAKWLINQLPPVIYYPNFLFEFPDKIYIEEFDGESRENRFYRTFLQDVLDSLDNDLDLETHILVRARSMESSDREALESVHNRLSSKISSLVFDPELSVFKVDNKDKRSVVVTLPHLDPTTNKYYVSIKIRDGDDSYFIRERSLGFRWFFTFLLLTQFRISRTAGRAPIFLFDEPASNLHQTAQQRLLKALKQLTTASGVSVIYTTHSHHLIEPKRLESTFIVKNMALEAVGLNDDFTASMTDIAITPYRQFVANHPDQRNYFQPILDVLEYRPGNLENIPNVVMTEGKTDFYLLSLFEDILGASTRLNFLPGGGAGGLDTPIQLYLAWGRQFFVLLDDDAEGRKQKRRYVDNFGAAVDGRILTLGDIDKSWSGGRIENLLNKGDRMTIQAKFFPDSKRFTKKRFHWAVQEALIGSEETLDVGPESKENFRTLHDVLEKKFIAS